jgi:O-antigen/teichoic acid export membrane protein
MLFKLLSVTLFFQLLGNNLLGVLRAEERASIYTGFTIFTLIVSLSLNILFVAVLDRKIQGLLEAQLITNILNAFVLYPLTMKGKKIGYSHAMIMEVMAFGVPLIPALIADLVLSMADRYFLDYYVSSQEVGLYSLGYRIAGMITVIIFRPFKIAWPPYMFRIATQDNAKEIYKIVLVYFVFISFWVGLGLSVLSREVLFLLTTPQYYEAYTIVPLIVVSYILFGMVSILIACIHITKKTKYGAIFMIVSAVVNTALNFLLIPLMGMMGAAISTIIAYIVLNVGIFRYSQKLYPINHEFGRMFQIVLVSSGLYGLSLFINYFDNMIIAVTLKTLLCLSFPLILILFNFYKPEEKKEIKNYYNRMIRPFIWKLFKIGR